MLDYTITVNTYTDSSFAINAWNIRDKNDEPERISIKKGNKEYSLVLAEIPYLEIWSLDSNKELDKVVNYQNLE